MFERNLIAVAAGVAALLATAAAEARCGGHPFVGIPAPMLPVGAPATTSGGPVVYAQPVLVNGVVMFVPAIHWPEVPPIRLPGIAESKPPAGEPAPIPVDANGMPRRRC